MGKRRTPLALLAAAALLAASMIVTAAPSASACAPMTKRDVFKGLRAGTMETMSLRTLNIDITWPKVVEVGDVAVIKANVTRPAKEDPAGLGIPMERPYVEPAEGVTVGVGLSIGQVYLPGAGMTDAKGNTTIRIKLEPWTPRGKKVNASSYAWRVAYYNQCLTIQEDGYTAAPGAFKTAP